MLSKIQYKTSNYKIPYKNPDIEKNLIFIGTIYDTFEALEETLGKMHLSEPLYLTYLAKKSFADTIFNYVKDNNKNIYMKNIKSSQKRQFMQ